MKPTLKLYFSDFWPGFDPYKNYFYKVISNFYNIEITQQADLLIYSVYGKDYLEYKCTRLFYTAENVRPDFTSCDYCIGFDYLNQDNYLRIPLYVLYLDGNFLSLSVRQYSPEAILESKTGFCNMVVSNPHSKYRVKFFEKLNKYKKVDSGGKYLNNIGGAVTDKKAFIRQYKFSMAFENSSYPGYTTEKIIEPVLENSIPIYWGNPLIEREFNSKSFINIIEHKSIEESIERIIEIDRCDELYFQYLREPFLNKGISYEMDAEALLKFIKKIVASIGNNIPIAVTYKRYIHTLKRKSLIFGYELKQRVGFRNFR